MKTRVLVADDHPLARQAVRSLIEGEDRFEWIGEAGSGAEAIRLCGELLPDLVLMDIRMQDMNGLEATRRIKQLYPHIRVVMLTVSDDAADLFTAIRYGAQGYLLKNMDPDDWIAYLQGLLDEDGEISRRMADRLLQSFRTAGESSEPEIGPGVLSPRECEILSCVSSGQSNRQIAETLVITENTVKNHIKNILAKLELDNRVQLTAYAVRHGLTQIGHKPGGK
ncbi:Transcriptional regulatory protein DegU [Paenibacillus solanacearum]|uniref:Transcriptional regulatory protein DegU n=1 Tax=Paenibacillus solanacearum TaxID=2048548 RepID=A0A916K237_9BACL|nr:response regulator transcription factor [Paenibacillus solanacearum]CAG7630543.1 Transcriptional regulatory protein DegU [Paenibacillus solanacearum]